MIFRIILVTLVFLFAAPAANADERVTVFDVLIDVERDGDILVTEKISVNAEGYQIRRGIYRELPRRYEKNGRALPYVYDVKTVMRDGRAEAYAIEKDGNAFRIRIGDADKFLENGPHSYEIVYEVKNQVRYFDGYDEIYWNATGNYWNFPIDAAHARVRLPGEADAAQLAAYTGRQGETGSDYEYRFLDGAHSFTAGSTLWSGEGLTVAVGFEKGVVDPPSTADARAEWWALNASRFVLGFAFFAIGGLYLWLWRRIGRDPPKGPVFARYEPPAGYSPAAVHRIYHRGFSGHDALIATLVNLGVKKRIHIDATEKKKTVLKRLDVQTPDGTGAEDLELEQKLFAHDMQFSFGEKYNSTLTSAYEQFKSALNKAYGAPYFKWNRGFLVLALLISLGAVIVAANLAIEWTAFHTFTVIALVLMGIAASYFLPAPTPKGQEVRTEIEGFRLYLETAEKLQLNAVKVGSDAPPPMTVERYERFLPFAVALGVEKPWTNHFEKLMPHEAAEYRPYWSSGNYGGGRSLSAVNSALVSGIASGVSASMPQSSSSSGSGGGGSSGGGGGGGGGGGW